MGSQTRCEKDYGINRECILTELPLISISRSFPHDWMHLCLENHGKNLISFWKGTYKGMDEGQCQGASETENVSHPSAHGTLTDLWNRHSRGWVPAECLEQKMLYAYATVCTQGDFTLSRK